MRIRYPLLLALFTFNAQSNTTPMPRKFLPILINSEYILPTTIITRKPLYSLYATNKTGTVLRYPRFPRQQSLEFDRSSYKTAHLQIQLLSELNQLEGVKVNSRGHIILAIRIGTGKSLSYLLSINYFESYKILEKVRIAAMEALDKIHKLNISHNNINMKNILIQERSIFSRLRRGRFKVVIVNYEDALIHLDWPKAPEIARDDVALKWLFDSIVIE